VEKQLPVAAYRIGLASAVVAIILRGLAVFGVFAFAPLAAPGRVLPSYRSFLESAALFFLMAIAGAVLGNKK
jgi:hypothetical protein